MAEAILKNILISNPKIEFIKENVGRLQVSDVYVQNSSLQKFLLAPTLKGCVGSFLPGSSVEKA